MSRKLYDAEHKYRIPVTLSAELRPYVLKINANTEFRNRMISGIPVIYKNDAEVISRDYSIFVERLVSPDKWIGVVTQLELDYDPYPNTDLDAAHLTITNLCCNRWRIYSLTISGCIRLLHCIIRSILFRVMITTKIFSHSSHANTNRVKRRNDHVAWCKRT